MALEAPLAGEPGWQLLGSGDRLPVQPSAAGSNDAGPAREAVQSVASERALTELPDLAHLRLPKVEEIMDSMPDYCRERVHFDRCHAFKRFSQDLEQAIGRYSPAFNVAPDFRKIGNFLKQCWDDEVLLQSALQSGDLTTIKILLKRITNKALAFQDTLSQHRAATRGLSYDSRQFTRAASWSCAQLKADSDGCFNIASFTGCITVGLALPTVVFPQLFLFFLVPAVACAVAATKCVFNDIDAEGFDCVLEQLEIFEKRLRSTDQAAAMLCSARIFEDMASAASDMLEIAVEAEEDQAAARSQSAPILEVRLLKLTQRLKEGLQILASHMDEAQSTFRSSCTDASHAHVVQPLPHHGKTTLRGKVIGRVRSLHEPTCFQVLSQAVRAFISHCDPRIRLHTTVQQKPPTVAL